MADPSHGISGSCPWQEWSPGCRPAAAPDLGTAGGTAPEDAGAGDVRRVGGDDGP